MSDVAQHRALGSEEEADAAPSTQPARSSEKKNPFVSDTVKRGLLGRIRRELRPYMVELHRKYLKHFWGMDIGERCMISLSAKLDKAYPRGIHIGDDTAVSFGAVILSHDFTRDLHVDTFIGSRCAIGARSFIMPGVVIGDEVIVAPGSVVMTNVASNTIVAGNPARPLERGIRTGPRGRLIRDPAPPAPDAAGAEN